MVRFANIILITKQFYFTFTLEIKQKQSVIDKIVFGFGWSVSVAASVEGVWIALQTVA